MTVHTYSVHFDVDVVDSQSNEAICVSRTQNGIAKVVIFWRSTEVKQLDVMMSHTTCVSATVPL